MDFLFLSFFGGGVLAILAIATYSGVSPFRISVFQAFLIKSLIISFAGYPLLYFQVYDYRVSQGIVDQGLITIAMLAAFFSIAIPLLVAWLLKYSFWRQSKLGLANQQGGRYRRCSSKPALSVCYWFFISAVVIVVLVAYLSKVPSIALFEAFHEGDVALSRSQMTNDFSGGYHWYSLFFHDISRLAALVFFSYALVRRTTLSWLLFIGVFILSAFGLIMTSQKAPFGWFLVSIVFTYFFVRKGGVISVKGMLIAVVLALVVLVPSYVAFMGAGSLSSALYSISSRALTGQLVGGYNYQWIFPGHVEFLWGRSLPNPRGIFPFEHYRLTVEVMNIVNPHIGERGVVGSQPTMYWGEAYANFSWAGLVLVSGYVGAFLFAVSEIVKRIRVFEVKAAATVWVGLEVSTFASSGFSWSLLPMTLIVGFLVIFLHDKLSKIFQRSI